MKLIGFLSHSSNIFIIGFWYVLKSAEQLGGLIDWGGRVENSSKVSKSNVGRFKGGCRYLRIS